MIQKSRLLLLFLLSLLLLDAVLAAPQMRNMSRRNNQKKDKQQTNRPKAKNTDSSDPLLNLKKDGTVDISRGADGNKNDKNFCNGKTLRDGTQNKSGACSPTVQGDLPSFDKMVSTIIISPKNGETIEVGQPFKIAVDVANMDLGAFDDPASEYYVTPQTLNRDGKVIGHIHVVAQKMGSNNNGNRALDARKFAFFKGLESEGDDNGRRLSVDVVDANGKAGLQEAGEFRICSITGQRGHAPVIMPVAKRGSQDDCIRVNVVNKNNKKEENKKKDTSKKEENEKKDNGKNGKN